MEKIYRIITRIFYIVLFIFPFLSATILALFNLTVGWDRLGISKRSNLFYNMDGFEHPYLGVGICFITIFLMMLIYVCIKHIAKKKYHYYLVAFMIAVLLRGTIWAFYKNTVQPFSDFAASWENAKGNLFLLGHYQFFPAYLNYAVFERIITHFDRKYYIVVLSSVLLNGITAVGICMLGDEVLGKCKYGFFASLIYAFLPSGILYAQLGNPEHITVACNVFGLYIVIVTIKRIFRNEGKQLSSIAITMLAGVLFGVGNSMKSFFAVIVVALVLSFILLIIKWDRNVGKKYVSCLLLFGVLIFSSAISKGAILRFTEHIFNIEEHSEDAFPHFLMVGLTREGEGQIGKTEDSRLYIVLKENGYDSKTAKSVAFGRLIEDWKNHEKEIPIFLLKKIVWEWQSDDTPFWYFKYSMCIVPESEISNQVFNFINEYGSSIGEVFYLFVMGLCLIAAFFEIKSREDNKLGLLLVNLCIFGFFCLMLLFEAQSRYKCLVMPFLCIMAAHTITRLDRNTILEE